MAAGRRALRIPCVDPRDLSTQRSRLVFHRQRRRDTQQGRRCRSMACRPAALLVRPLGLVVGLRGRGRCRCGLSTAGLARARGRCRAPQPPLVGRTWVRGAAPLERGAGSAAPLPAAGESAARTRRRDWRASEPGAGARARLQRRNAAARRAVRRRLVVADGDVVVAAYGADRRRTRGDARLDPRMAREASRQASRRRGVRAARARG